MTQSKFARILTAAAIGFSWCAQAAMVLPGTQFLERHGDFSAQMVSGIDLFLERELARSLEARPRHWHRDFSSEAAYEGSVAANRQRLAGSIGAVDARLPAGGLEFLATTTVSATIAETPGYMIYSVRWPVLDGIFAEGLMLEPKERIEALVVALPDADHTPEMFAGLAPGLSADAQLARRFAEHGCLVLVPALIDRDDTWSGSRQVNRFTNQPHREWIYRQSYQVGRHIIGYEVQKVLAAVDYFENELSREGSTLFGKKPGIGVAGHGEGALIAFYSAALDTRIDAAFVSGYFNTRQRIWEEPIYRNVFALLHEFGDAEIATLIAPRALVIEHSQPVEVAGPPTPRSGRSGAAPGRIVTPDFASVEAEVRRAGLLLEERDDFNRITLAAGAEGVATGPGSARALTRFFDALGLDVDWARPPGQPARDRREQFDPGKRQHRQLRELQDFTQRIFRASGQSRRNFFWNRMSASSPTGWREQADFYRSYFHAEVLGRFENPPLPPDPRSRKLRETEAWTEYEVTLDVWPDVFAWGHLLVPKNMAPGERRPVVVCQHGLEGLPSDTITDDPDSRAVRVYKGYAATLAERGFVVFAPHNPYRGGDRFRVLQRKANPLKASLYSVMIAQHEQILNWLNTLEFVDGERIGFYGLSYGGKTAMRIPAVLDGYALSICSADFNEWIRKNVSVDSPFSYMFTGEYEMFEFNLGETFNYAEMAALIAPRPFMVERGHYDNVAPDEWVAYEYARVRRLYNALGLPEKTAIEFFDGGHEINGLGTFEFLDRHLGAD